MPIKLILNNNALLYCIIYIYRSIDINQTYLNNNILLYYTNNIYRSIDVN